MADRIHLLGGFDVILDGRETDQLKARPTCAALLAYVAAEGTVTRDVAAAMLWPDSDTRRARHALNQTVYQIRNALGHRWILSRGQELRLGDGIRVDTAEMDEAFEAGEYDRALQVAGGRFLAGWHLRNTAPFEEWVDAKTRRYQSRLREACRLRIDGATSADDHVSAVEVARRWLRAEPAREEAHLALMRSLTALGRNQAAVDAHEAFADRLAELGGVPGPEAVSLASVARAHLQGRGRPPPETRRRVSTQRLLVLPFIHDGPRAHSHLTDGLADGLTARLSRVPGLAVIDRASALDGSLGRDAVEAGRTLDVDHVLTGRVHWSAPGARPSARTSVRLVRVADGAELWSADFLGRLDGASGQREEVAVGAMAALGLAPPEPAPAEGPESAESSPAYELCIRGLQHWHRRSQGEIREAIDLFIRACEADPEYARAYGCLALAYAMLPSFAGASNREWMPRAEHCAMLALDLDPELVEGRLAAGIVAFSFDLDAALAGQHWGRVLELEPSNAQALTWEAYRNATNGQPLEAQRLAQEALAINPLSLAVSFDVALIDHLTRDEDRAMERMSQVLAMDPGFTPAAFFLGAQHMRRGHTERARREWARIDAFGPGWKTFLADLGDRRRAIATLDRIVDLSPGPVHWYATSALYALLDEPARALHWLETHLRTLRGEPVRWATGGPSLSIVAPDPLFDSLRGTARFDALLRAMGTPRVDPGAAVQRE